MVEMAELILDEVSAAVQAEGWIFNTEYGYPFTPLLPVTLSSLTTCCP